MFFDKDHVKKCGFFLHGVQYVLYKTFQVLFDDANIFASFAVFHEDFLSNKS